MFRIKKNSNLLETLYHRELHLAKSPYKLTLNALAQLVLSKQSTFVKVHQISSRNNIDYEFERIFCNNYQKCLSPYNKLLYRLESPNAKKRICDVEMFCGPVYNNKICNCHFNCTCTTGFIITLSEDDWLHLYNIHNGKLLREVYVACRQDSKYYSFRHCSWNTYGEDVVLISKLNPESKGLNRTNVVAALAVFKVLPFEFHVLFEVERAVFGESCDHANISENILILGMNSYSNRAAVHLYSFLDILEEGFKYEVHLGETCGILDNGDVGSFPTGLPVNCHLKSPPPLLFVVKCAEQIVHFGGFPWQFLIVPSHQNRYDFHVKSVDSFELAINGHLSCDNFPCENDAVFHPDNSGRIIFRTAHAVEFFKLQQIDNAKVELKKFASMDFKSSLNAHATKQLSNLRARKCKQTKKRSVDLCCKSILCTDYEDELDLFVVLGIDPDDSECKGIVKIFDNFTGKELKNVQLGISLADFNDYNICMNLDFIIIFERTRNNKNVCYIYRLKTS